MVERVAGGGNDFGKSELLLMVMGDPAHSHVFGSGTWLSEITPSLVGIHHHRSM